MTRGARRVFLGAQWDADSWDGLPPLCARLLEKTGPLPLHWNFPALPPDSLKKTRTWLEKTVGPRLDAGTDAAAPMGFAGACHPFLNLDELEKELAWSRKNPWGTGIADVLGMRPSILIPRMPDAVRPEALKLYADHGFTALGVCRDGTHSWFGLGGLPCFTYSRLRVSAGAPSPFSARFRELTGARTDLFLMLDLSEASLARLQEVLDKIVAPLIAPARSVIGLLTEPPSALPPGRQAAGKIDWSPFPAPLLRRKLSSTAGIARRKRKKNEDYRELLGILSPVRTPQEETAPAAPSPPGTRLVAQMLGEVVLAGNVFDVRLDGGRFCGLTHAGRQLLPARPAASYLRVGGKTMSFQTRNSFSFEGDGGTGLREELDIDSHDGASLAIEYSFRDDCPMLEIRAEVHWPVIEGELPVDEHAPLVISLLEARREEAPVVEAVAPNDGAVSVRVTEDGWLVVPGASHRIALPGGGALILRSAGERERGWNAVSFRLARDGRRRILEANPFGGWAPVSADALSGKRQSFRLLMGLDEDVPQARERR